MSIGRLLLLSGAACLCLQSAHTAQGSPQVFGLTTAPVQAERKPLGEHPLLARTEHRELGRQAILLAAREELGCATRDQSLGEPIDSTTQAVFEATIESRHGQGLRIILRQEDRVLCDTAIECPIGPVFDVERLATQLERLTRTLIADAIESAGVKRTSNDLIDSAPTPDQTEVLLARMDHVSQFHALRVLHSAIRSDGESLERISAVARAYANLAMLDRTTLDARSAAYRARAMLYTARLQHRAPDSRETAWTAAYVYALIGYPTIALDALKARDAFPAGEDAPGWLRVVVDGCHHNFEDLAETAYGRRDPYAELAALLLMRSAVTSGSKVLAIETGRECVQTVPGCLWIVDAVDSLAGVSLRHQTSLVGPNAHWRLLTEALPEMEQLANPIPVSVGDESDEHGPIEIARVANRLLDSGAADTLEPSWGLLGSELQAWNAQHVYRRADFLRHGLDWDTSDYLSEMEPAIAGSPWAPAIRTLAVEPTRQTEPYNELLSDFIFLDANYLSSAHWLWDIPEQATFKNMLAREARYLANGAMSGDEIVFSKKLANKDPKTRVRYARWMADCSEHSPLRYATLIRDDPKVTEEQVAAWAAEYADHPVVALALGRRSKALGNREEAIEYYRSYLTRAPDPSRFRELATIYYQLGSQDWIGTLEEVFRHEDYALSHSYASATIAATMLQEGEYAEALSWAERASFSGAGWAWSTQCECLAANGRFADTVSLARQNSERYNNPEWYHWCVLVDHGDLDAAKEAHASFLEHLMGPDSLNLVFFESIHLMALGEDQEALDLLLRHATEAHSHIFAIQIALLADKLGNLPLRDEWLKREASTQSIQSDFDTPDERRAYKALAEVLREAINEQQLDSNSITQIVDHLQLSDGWRPRLQLFAGMYYSNRGDDDSAIEQWKACIREIPETMWPRLLATVELRKRGLDPFHVENRKYKYALENP